MGFSWATRQQPRYWRGPNDEVYRVFLQVAYLLEDGFKDRIALLSPEDRAQLIWDIRFLLVSLGAPFDGVVEPLTAINFLETRSS